jgi:hypothetical protein
LRENIKQNVDIEDFENYLEKYLPVKLVEKAKNPEKFHEHIL